MFRMDSRFLFCFVITYASISSSAYRVSDQFQLDRFIDNITSLQPDEQQPRTIQLSLTPNVYQLNITKFVRRVNALDNYILIVKGENGEVLLNCVDEGVVNISREHLQNRRMLQASMIVLDRLVFTGCVLPVYVEEVDTVVIQNCVFR